VSTPFFKIGIAGIYTNLNPRKTLVIKVFTSYIWKMKQYKFKSLRVKKFDPHPKIPDYSNVVELGGKHFTLTGWLKGSSSDIDYVLEIITPDRLEKNKFLRRTYAQFLEDHKGIGRRS
jgi:hypothetical protein